MVNKQLLVKGNIDITEALKQLDETAGKVLFIVDDDKKLIGTLTDGDIRRYLLKGKSLQDNIKDVYNRSPKCVNQEDLLTKEAIKKLFFKFKIALLPVLDSNKTIVDILSWDNVISEVESGKVRKKKVKIPLVIMAGGKGTRLDPFTKVLPKPLIPIGNKPIIELIMEKFFKAGVKDFYITLNHKAKMIKAYLEDFSSQYRITYLDEDKPLGTAGGLKPLHNKINGSFFVTNSDIIIEEDYHKILQYHEKNKNDITVVASIKNYNIPYGVCEIENGGNLLQIKEKPEMSFLVNTGMYILNSSALNLIPKDEFYHITQLIIDVKGKGGKVGVFPISEKLWIDVGEWGQYKLALKHFDI